MPPTMCSTIGYVRATDCEERVPVYSLHSRHLQAWVKDLPGTTTPTKYTTGTILTLPLQSGPCLLGSVEPRTAIVLPPAPIVNKVKEKLLEFEHWFAPGLVASFTAHLCTEFGVLGKASGLRCPALCPPGVVRTQFPSVETPLRALMRWAVYVRQ